MERTFRAMGTDCHVLVTADEGGGELLDLARERIELLEQSWSRFRPDSELNRLNSTAGRGAIPVSEDLLTLVQRMHDAWGLTDGRFDPTVLQAVRALGYDEDFATVVGRPAAAFIDDVTAIAAPGMSGVVIDAANGRVALPDRVGIDPGAIGKGLASDIVLSELMAAGADGVLVNLGGDLAFAGATADGRPWSIGIEDERLPQGDPDRLLRVLEFPTDTERAGVATSTTLKRRWAQGRRHHVVDPRTGTMGSTDLVQVTVSAEDAWQAEITATAALLMQSEEAISWLRQRDITAILVTTDRITLTDEVTSRG